MGDILDIFYVCIVILVFIIAFFVLSLVMTQFSSSTNETLSDSTSQYVITAGKNTFQVYDAGLVVLLFGAFASIIISAFFIKTHPVFFFVSLLVFVIVLMILPIFSNIAFDVANSTQIKDEANKYPLAVNIINNIGFYAMLAGAIILIVLYAKISTGKDVGV